MRPRHAARIIRLGQSIRYRYRVAVFPLFHPFLFVAARRRVRPYFVLA